MLSSLLLRGLVTWEQREPAPDVLIVTSGWPFPEKPAYAVFTKRQVESLAARGLRCDVLFIRGYRSAIAYAVAAFRLAALNFGHRGYSLVHAHGGEAAPAAWFYRRAPLLVSYLGDDLLGTPREDGSISKQSRIRRAFLRQHARVARATITKSAQMRCALPTSCRARNTVIPNGVDRELFHPIDRAQARRKLGWGDEPVALFLADPIVPRKRHWLAASACERASSSLPGLRLEVAKEVEPDQVPLLMSAADCLLLTSSIEGSPNAVKEALMCDLPVVTTRVGDVEEILAGVEPSYICDTEEELAAALVECLGTRRRSNGRASAEHLALDRVAERVAAVYASVGRHSRASASAPARPSDAHRS